MKNENRDRIKAFLSEHTVEICFIGIGLILLLIGSGIITFRWIRYAKEAGPQVDHDIFACIQSNNCNDFTLPIILSFLGVFLLVFGILIAVSVAKGENKPVVKLTAEEKREKIYEQTGNYLYHPVFADYLHPEQYVIEGSTQERYQYFAIISREQGAVERTILKQKIKLSGLLLLIGIISFCTIGIFASKLKNTEIGITVLQILCYVGYGGCTLAGVLKFVGALHSTIGISEVRRYRKAIGKAIRKRFGDESLEEWNRRMDRLDAYDEKSKDGE